ncbi:MAG: UPF0236 family protein [Bacilli bacterium]|nr:UPF0236 family protein [Bacilli bacterium]
MLIRIDFLSNTFNQSDDYCLILISKILEEFDLELAATRDKRLEILKKEPRTILTSKGPITFKRRYYYDTNNDTYLYLLDNILEIPKYSRLSKELKIKILSSLNHLSYKDAGIDNLPKGNEISTVYVFNHLNKSTTNVEYISFNTANKTIHVQIDEKYISMKSKRKKHQIEDYIQLVYLLILINQRKKHILVNRTIISARSLNKLFQRINATLVKLYCVEINDKIYISGDLAPYIQNSPERITVCNAIYVPDKFHVQRLAKKYIGQKIEIFNISKFDSHIEAYIDTLDNYPYDKNDNDYHTLLNLIKKIHHP